MHQAHQPFPPYTASYASSFDGVVNSALRVAMSTAVVERRAWQIVALVALTLALPCAARADDGLRCGNRIVSVGEREYSVEKKCGAPTRAQRWVDYRDDGSPNLRTVLIDVWTYDFGPTQFIRILTFENEILQNVETGDYGTP